MENRKEKTHSAIFFTLLLSFLVAQPFTCLLNLPIAIALLLNWIVEGNWKAKWGAIDTVVKKLLFSSSILFFIIHIIGIFYSSDTAIAVSEIEYKIWFLVAPLVIFTVPPDRLNSKRLLLLAQGFILSSLALILLNLSISAYEVSTHHSFYYFTYVWLSHFMHPSYSSMMICTAFIISSQLFFNQQEKLSSMWRIICKIGMIVFPIYIFMLQSKAGWLAFSLVFVLMGIYLINGNRKRYAWTAIFIALLILLPTALFVVIPEPYNRMKPAVKHLLEKRNVDNPTDGTNQRLVVWKSACSVARQHPLFGVGPGDVKEELTKEYAQRGYTHVSEKQFNTHNQYLQTLVGLGTVGLFILSCYLFIPLGYTIKYRRFASLLFFIIVIINLFPESMLERKAGADFIGLGVALLTAFTGKTT
ncbi:MAG: O-antigen ligase family protein [Bacteroidales bacterium]|jgi:O-antigen ligase|nr:O-antigen ligase family protein [Bacteroidales bacterium]